MPSPDLVARIEALGSIGFEGEAYRHLGPSYAPLSGQGARIQGGRWNPPDSFPTLYLALDEPTVVAEFYRAAQRQNRPPEDLAPRKLYRYEVRLDSVLDLRSPRALERLDVSEAALRGNDLTRTQAVGKAAHDAGLEGLLAPSAVGPGPILVVFLDRVRAGSFLRHVAESTWDVPPPRG